MNNLLQIGIVLTAIDRMSGVLGGATDKAGQGFSKLQQRIHQCSQAMTEMGTKATALGQGLVSALKTPITAFADLDEASTQLRVAMMDNFGQIPPQFAEINRQAIELGNVLPGTTADFVNSARALIENGTSLETIVGGGLKAAAYLGVILKIPQAGAAEMVAKFREAFGLAENELEKMADLTQRAKFAFGLGPEEIKYAAQYAGATLNNLKLTGIENTKMFLAMQGMARQKGMEGSVFGTNFASMLNNIGMMESKLHRNSKVMKEVNADLRHAGIRLQFFDKAGKFVGLENMVAQLEKLKVLSAQDKLNVMNRLFGMEGGRVAAMLSDSGVGGLHGAMDTMARQADLMKRIEETNTSAKNIWEALTGTITNFWAAFGGPMVTSLYPYMKAVNDFVGGPMMDWVDRNKDLVKWLGLGAMAVAGLLVTLGALGIVFGALGQGAMFALGGLRVLSGAFMLLVNTIGALGRIVAWIGPIIGRTLLTAFLAAAKGAWSFTVALLANPITWIIAGIIALGVAIYMLVKHWDVVKASAQQFWGWLTSWAGQVGTAIGQAVSKGWEATKAASAQALSAMSEVGTKIVAAFQAIPSKLFDAGAAMLDMLIAGIKSKIGAVVNTVSGLTERIRGFFNRSPAKEGALRDIHQHPFSEMVAQAIRPEPVVKSVRAMTSAAVQAMAPMGKSNVAAKAASLMGDPKWQDPRLQAILRKHGGATAAAAASSSAPGTPKGLGRRVPISGAPATPAPITRTQAAAKAAHPAVAAKAASLMGDPKWQDPRLQAILRKHGGATAAAKPLPSTPAQAPRPQPRASGGGGAGGAARGSGGRAGGGSVSVTYNVNAQGGADKGAIMAALKQHEHELVRLIEQVMARNGRRQY